MRGARTRWESWTAPKIRVPVWARLARFEPLTQAALSYSEDMAQSSHVEGWTSSHVKSARPGEDAGGRAEPTMAAPIVGAGVTDARSATFVVMSLMPVMGGI